MTTLKKPVTRVVDFGRGKIALTLHPDNIITFRHHRGRKRFAVEIGQVFVLAVGKAVAAARAEKRKRRSR